MAVNGNFSNLNASPNEANGEQPAAGDSVLAGICASLCQSVFKDTPLAEMFGPPQTSEPNQSTPLTAPQPVVQNGKKCFLSFNFEFECFATRFC
jgi:hypothetical protein